MLLLPFFKHKKTKINIENLTAIVFFIAWNIGNGSKEPETLQPYLDLLVDELLELSSKTVYDAYSKAPFQFKCEVLSYVLDYPGVGKVFNVLGSGAYKACAWCEIQDKYLCICKLI